MPTNTKIDTTELTSESEILGANPVSGLQYNDEEAQILLFIRERYDRMRERKEALGIDAKCDLYDRLYAPHKVAQVVDRDKEFDRARLFVSDDGRKSNKSKPIAFEKVQTALATIIKENPKAAMKPFSSRYKALNEIVKAAYEENWDRNRLLMSLREFTFQMAKYGVAYGRRYIKKEYKIVHEPDGEGKVTKERVVKFYDTIFEVIHPKRVLLDEQAKNPRDARDCFIVDHFTLNQLRDMYPDNDRINNIPQGRWLTEGDRNFIAYEGQRQTERSGIYEHLVYENVYKDIKLTIVNGVLISDTESVLPGHQLSLFGEKWAEKDETYDGIGICEILENYQPLIDDIANADIDLVREVIRPRLYMGAGIELADEAADEVEGQKIIKFQGDISQLVFQRPTRTGDATQILEFMGQEVDDATGIARDLSAISEAKTLGQAAFNRENSLRRLSLPLESIKYALEDDANKALNLLRLVNIEPIKTYVVTDPAELIAANAILKQNPNDERFVGMPDGKLVRRLFREAELPVELDPENSQFYQSQARKFWELIPATFKWEGLINIIPMSFIGESQAMEQQTALEDLNILTAIPDMGPTGQPVLVDEQGKAYKINRPKIIRDYLITRRKDPDEYLVEMTPMNIAGDNQAQPMTNPGNLAPSQSERMGIPSTGEK